MEVCGDGIFIGLTSECDDHNTDNGDGCSDSCTIEYGFSCTGRVCKDSIPPTMTIATVEKPNVLVFEFDEPVYIVTEGKTLF